MMETQLKAGQILDSNFEILAVKDLEELAATGIWARHRTSGAEVFHILNDDKENLFAFAFKTPPQDSTGAAHILEHSVLCGSRRYPLKDAFIVLAQGSLQTFLNAITYPDKTIYPASSINENDYFNLMSVYGDAVFHPLLTEWTFLQEGHRLQFVPLDEGDSSVKKNAVGNKALSEKLSITGVVYNEMKGAYSSLENTAGHWSVKAVLPDTVYAHDSGGDPQAIPLLDWEGLKKFHNTHYAPANCRIFLAGNIPTEAQFSFLNEKFLASLQPGEALPPIEKARAWDKNQTVRVPCPSGSEPKSTVMLSWCCSDIKDTSETIAIEALTETLLGHDGSPLTRALVESRLGEDIAPVSGFEGDLRETVFTVGLRGAKEKGECYAKKIEEFILDELRRLAKEGIPPEEIEAALLALEFNHREIRRSGGPYSLTWLRRSLRCWLHGSAPWESLLFAPAFDELKRRLKTESRYFEGMIEKYLINNPHRALIMIEPEEDYLERQETALETALAEKQKSLSKDNEKRLRRQSAALERIQSAADSPKNLAAIPHISRKELLAEEDSPERNFHDAGGVPLLSHSLFTNGITYINLAFPLDIFDAQDYLWFSFYSQAAVSVGLPGMNYAKVSSLLARTAGDFHALLQTGALAPGASRSRPLPSGILDLGGRDWVVFRLKALDEKLEAALELAYRLITGADFTDTRRLEDLSAEIRNEADSSVAYSGHHFAAGLAGSLFSRSRGIEEIWHGLRQVLFTRELCAMSHDEIGKKLTSIRDTLTKRGGLIAHVTASQAAIEKAHACIAKFFGPLGSPRSRGSGSGGLEAFTPLIDGAVPGKPVVCASASLQISFAALAMKGSPYGSREQAAELVLSHLLSTGALWEDIRMKGGAYGAFAYPDRMEETFFLSSYRDPNPLRSLDSFKSILEIIGKTKLKESELEKIIIGAYSKETRPRTNAERGNSDFFRYLYGIEAGDMKKRLVKLRDISAAEVKEAARRLAASAEAGASAVLCPGQEAERTAAALGANVTKLTV